MGSDKNIEQLFQYAATYQFEYFDRLFSKLSLELPFESFWEAYLMRAQIKLYITNPTFFDDLEKAEIAGEQARFPPLGAVWRADSPNRFLIFPPKSGVLQTFLRMLGNAREKMARWYGDQGVITLRQLQGEISYFMGDTPRTLEFVEEQLKAPQKNHTDAVLSHCSGFRSHLAFGHKKEAEQCMLDMIRLSKAYPECIAPYQALRIWATLTTSWNGDSPRFYEEAGGRKLPVLDDRLESIRNGSPRTTPLEMPFIEYAKLSYEGAYALRQYYMDLFHAMYWLSVGAHKQAESYFLKLYKIATASDVIMPFVECGEQIIPLLQYIQNSNLDCSHEWLARIIAMAVQYEKSLNTYIST